MKNTNLSGFSALTTEEMSAVNGGASAGVSAARAIGGIGLLVLVGGCAALSAPVSVPILLTGALVSGVSIGSASWKNY